MLEKETIRVRIVAEENMIFFLLLCSVLRVNSILLRIRHTDARKRA